MKLTWLDMITVAMKNLGGHAKFKDLYDEVETLYYETVHSKKDFKAQIRGTIERNSSDSDVYHRNNSKKDIFYMVGEKGDGHWGLRNFEPNGTEVDFTDDDEGFPEGKKKLRMHLCRERNYKVISEAKKLYKKKNGKLVCQICNFDFSEKYGDIGEDFIEAHHTIPVSQLNDDDKTNIKDIVLVCSNCHRMLHRKRPWLEVNRLKDLLEKK